MHFLFCCYFVSLELINNNQNYFTLLYNPSIPNDFLSLCPGFAREHHVLNEPSDCIFIRQVKSNISLFKACIYWCLVYDKDYSQRRLNLHRFHSTSCFVYRVQISTAESQVHPVIRAQVTAHRAQLKCVTTLSCSTGTRLAYAQSFAPL